MFVRPHRQRGKFSADLIHEHGFPTGGDDHHPFVRALRFRQGHLPNLLKIFPVDLQYPFRANQNSATGRVNIRVLNTYRPFLLEYFFA